MNLFTYMQKKTLAGILVFAIFISPIVPVSYSYAEIKDPNYIYTGGMLGDSASGTTADDILNDQTGGLASNADPLDTDTTGGNTNKIALSVFGCGNGPKRFIKSIQDLSSLYEAQKVLKSEGLAGGLSPLTNVLGTTAKTAVEIKALAKDIKDAKLIAGASTLAAQQTADKETQKSLVLINSKIDKQLAAAEEQKVWEQCLNGIAYKVTKHQIANMTQKTINWVNSGFAGDPLFIKDQKTFFKNIETKTMRSILGPISAYNNTTVYPYGQDLARSMINGFKTTFEERAKSTLQQSLPSGSSPDDFTNDFTQGGWSAWESFTLNPQNNPLGFQMITTQHIADEAAKDVQAQKDELTQKDFIGQKKCVEWEADATKEDKNHPFTLNSTKLNDPDAQDKCIRYETITPGGVTEALINAQITSPIRQLEIANTINESLDSVFTALISQLSTKGFSSLSSFSTQNNEITADYTPKRYYNSYGYLIQVSKTHGGWYNKGGKFDITRDLDDIYTNDATGKKTLVKKGIITTQKDYLEAATAAMKGLGPILPAIGKLDYCIPGPNPGWEQRTDEKIAELVDYMQNQSFNGTKKSMLPKWVSGNTFGTFTGIGAAAGTVIPGVGNAVGALVGLAIDVGLSVYDKVQKNKNENNKVELEAQYAKAEANFYANQNAQIANFSSQFQSYSDYVHKKYDTIVEPKLPDGSNNPQYLPMAQAGLDIVKNLDRYDANVKQAYQDYDEVIGQTKTNIRKLEAIKKRVDEIVKGARKRWAKEITDKLSAPGQKIDWSCFDTSLGQGGDGSNDLADGANGTRTQEGTALGADFDTPQQDTQAPVGKCTTEVTATGISVNGDAPFKYSWSLKTGQDVVTLSAGEYKVDNNQLFSAKVDAYKDSGLAKLTLTVEDGNGDKATKTKDITIAHKDVDARGVTCPKPPEAPGTPYDITANIVSDTTADLSWSAPTNTGTSPITDYTIEYAPYASFVWTKFAHTASSTTKRTVTGLDNKNKTYKFRIAAVNAVGSSATSQPVTPKVTYNPQFDVTAAEDTDFVKQLAGMCMVNITITNKNSANASTYNWTLSTEFGNQYVSVNPVKGTGATNQPPNPAFSIDAHKSYGKTKINLTRDNINGTKDTAVKEITITKMNTNQSGNTCQ